MPDTTDGDIRDRDLCALGVIHPAEHGLSPEEREQSVQRFGRRCLVWGLSIFVATVVASLSAAIVCDLSLFDSEAGRLFGVLGGFTLSSLGTILMAFAAAEGLQRPQRAAARLALTEARQANQKYDIVIGLVSATPGRLDGIEQSLKKVRRFEDGVELGAELRRSVLGRDNL